ncbi:hypothetical protein BGZ98_001552 [Dissophora globulifera]|nr:hypothetical protein BGZ98_001552 [Dissophora globulifera]
MPAELDPTTGRRRPSFLHPLSTDPSSSSPSQPAIVTATAVSASRGASSGFALPSSRPFTDTLGPSNPFSPSGSPTSSPEDSPLGTPATELQKLTIGEERYARAVEDLGVTGTFSGTVPLPSLGQGLHPFSSKRRPSKVVGDSLGEGEHSTGGAGGADPGTGGSALFGDGAENGINLTALKLALTGKRTQQSQGGGDLESNSKHIGEDMQVVEQDSAANRHDLAIQVDFEDRDDKIDADPETVAESARRRKPKGGVLSHLLKLQQNETAAVASGSSSAIAHRLLKLPTIKKTRKGFSYRSGSKNNSSTSLRDTSTPPSATTTPRVSPRNSVAFDRERVSFRPDARGSSTPVLRRDADNRSIHRDIAEILTRQSFLIMIAKALILYGAPSHRIEETCAMLAKKMEVDASFALLPGLMTISFNDPETHTSDTRHLRCSQGMDLNKLAIVHRIALEVLKGESIEKANQELEDVTLAPGIFPVWVTILGWTGSSAFVSSMAFNGNWWDMLLAGLCGLIVGVLGVVAARFPVYGNVFEMTSSIVVGFIAKAFGDRVCFQAVSLAGVVVLLPGLLLTQAIMELSSRNIVSGAVRMFYALMYAFFLGFGLTLGAQLWDYVSGGATAISISACQHPLNRWWFFLIFPLTSVSINIVFNAHPRQWFGMTLVAAVGFVVTLFVKSVPQITAALAAFAVGITGQLYGRVTGQLGYVSLLSGVLLLVPGSVGVRGILLIGSDPAQGATFVLTMIYIAVAITLGVFCASLVWYSIWRKSHFMSF